MILASVAGQDKLHFIKVFAKNHHTKIVYIKRNLIFSKNCEELTKSLFSLFLSNSVKTELTFHIIQRVKPFPCFSHILNTRLQSADSCSFHWRSSISANFTGLSNNGHSIQPQTLPEIYVVLNIFVLLQYLKFSSLLVSRRMMKLHRLVANGASGWFWIANLSFCHSTLLAFKYIAVVFVLNADCIIKSRVKFVLTSLYISLKTP